MTVESLIPHGDFVGLEGVTHLCTGGEAPWLKDQVETYAEFARCKSGGDRGRRLIYETGERCRERMGALWGVPAERIAFMPSAANSLNRSATSGSSHPRCARRARFRAG